MATQQHTNRANFLTNWLDAPYHLNTNTSFKLGVGLGIGVVIFSFLTILKPYVIQKITISLTSFAFATACVVSIVFLVYFFAIQPAFKNYFSPEKWTLGRHLFSFFCLLIISSTLNFNFNKYILKGEITEIFNYSDFFKTIISIGFFPMGLYLFVDERYGRYLKNKEKNNYTTNHQKELEVKEEKSIQKLPKTNQKVTIYSYNKKSSISFLVNDIIYITSQTNYASFYILNNDVIVEKTLRKPLTKIEKDLVNYSFIKRLHKSYIINTNYINEYNGNARGYVVSLNIINKQLPVSRKFTKKELEELL